MYVGTTQLLYATTYGETKPSDAETAMYQNLSDALSGTFDPTSVGSPVAMLLDLSTSEPSGLTMFDVLAASYGVDSATFDLLSAYEG